jgi:uncharacterized protein YndB with AHSA1/START domain
MENREMQISRIFKAPIDLIWEVWTNQEHIATWWDLMGLPTQSIK